MKRSSKKSSLFSERVINFYDSLAFPRKMLPSGVEVLYPYSSSTTRKYAQKFYDAFYADKKERVFVFGINPGRFGGGITGVPFTDPIALEEYCNIHNALEKRHELTSRFVYEVIDRLGGAKTFYASFFLTAVCPVGFVRKGKNLNYYDDPVLLDRMRPFIVETLKKQIDLGANRETTIVLGTWTNLKVFRSINEEFGFFEQVHTLEHPRFILQYRRKDVHQYLKKYKTTFSQAMS